MRRGRGRATSAPDTVIAGLPSPDENAEGGEGASAPDILLSQASSTSTIIPSAPLFKTRGIVQSHPHSNSLTLTRTHSNTDTLTHISFPFSFAFPYTLTYTLPLPLPLSIRRQSKDRGRPTSSSYRDNSPGSLDLDVKSLKAKEKEKKNKNRWRRTIMRLGYPVGGGSGRSLRLCLGLGRMVMSGAEKEGGKGGGKGREVREPKRQGSLAIATRSRLRGGMLRGR
jgi:hypothetical protein